MATVSYNDRMRIRYPELAHLYPASPAAPAMRGRGKAPATHRGIIQEHDGKIIGQYAACGTKGHYLHYGTTERDITCAKCLAGHFARK